MREMKYEMREILRCRAALLTGLASGAVRNVLVQAAALLGPGRGKGGRCRGQAPAPDYRSLVATGKGQGRPGRRPPASRGGCIRVLA